MTEKFQFDIKNYEGVESISLPTDKSFEAWLLQEQSFWTALEADLVEDPSNSRIATSMISRYNQLSTHLENVLKNPSPQNEANLQNQLKNQLHSNQIPFLSDSPAAIFINDILNNYGSRIAAHCLVIFQNHPHFNHGNFTATERIKSNELVGDFFSGEWKTKTASTVKSNLLSLKALHKRYSDHLSNIEIREENIFTEIATKQNKQETKLTKFKKVLRRRVARNIVTTHKTTNVAVEKTDDAIKEINQTKTAFTEFMHLEAPVTYWSEKAENHKISEKQYRCYLIFYAIACFILYALLLCVILVKTEETATAVPVRITAVIAGLGLTITTILMWTGRILTRMFLSEKHLRTDAEERSVMLQTYVALIKDGQATDAERAIVLAPIFRPTEDGLVKDDAAPLIDLSKIMRTS